MLAWTIVIHYYQDVQIIRLQLITNAAARLLTATDKRDEITLLWLPIESRIVLQSLQKPSFSNSVDTDNVLVRQMIIFRRGSSHFIFDYHLSYAAIGHGCQATKICSTDRFLSGCWFTAACHALLTSPRSMMASNTFSCGFLCFSPLRCLFLHPPKSIAHPTAVHWPANLWLTQLWFFCVIKVFACVMYVYSLLCLFFSFSSFFTQLLLVGGQA